VSDHCRCYCPNAPGAPLWIPLLMLAVFAWVVFAVAVEANPVLLAWEYIKWKRAK